MFLLLFLYATRLWRFGSLFFSAGVDAAAFIFFCGAFVFMDDHRESVFFSSIRSLQFICTKDLFLNRLSLVYISNANVFFLHTLRIGPRV